MAETITWLHISDSHFYKEKHNYESKEIFETFFDDLKTMKNKGLYPDLIFFTGDVAYGRYPNMSEQDIKNQYKEAKEFLDRIQNYFPDIPDKNIFIVPGNHDVNHKQITDSQKLYFEEIRKNNLVNAQKKINELIKNKDVEWIRFMERLNHYKDFLIDSDYKYLLEDPDRMMYSLIRDINGFKVGIAGLNSVWSSCGKDDRGRLWLGTYQILEAYNQLKGVNLSIALVHHPPSWFTEFEDFSITQIIERNFDFYLHGHDHQEWITPIDKHIRIASGALYNESKQTYGYNFVRLYPYKNRCEVFLRTYSYGKWTQLNIPNKTNRDGVWKLRNLKLNLNKTDNREKHEFIENDIQYPNLKEIPKPVSEFNNLNEDGWNLENLREIIHNDILHNKDEFNILVLGDVMLDSTMYMIDTAFDQVYDHGNIISRVSTLLTEDKLINDLKIASSDRRSLGGAAGIVTALLEIPKIHVDMVGVIGEDREGNEIRELFRNLKNCTHSKFYPIVIDKYPTVTKNYFHHVNLHHRGEQTPITYRYDREDRTLINDHIDEYENNFIIVLKKIEKIAAKKDTKYDCIIINDYEKGTINSFVIEWLQNIQDKYKDILIFVDPKYKFKRYKNIRIKAIIPNIKEASMGVKEFSGMPEKFVTDNVSKSELNDKDYNILKDYLDKCDSFIIKSDKNGAVIYSKDDNYSKIEVPSFQIDKSLEKSNIGCGDTFDAYFLLGQLKGYSLQDSVKLANIAAGIKRKKELGEVVSPQEIDKELTTLFKNK